MTHPGYVHYNERHGDEDRVRESDPTFRLDQLIAEAREQMGPARWNALNAEWENS